MTEKGFGRLEVIAFLAVIALSLTIATILINQLLIATPIDDVLSDTGSESVVDTPSSSDEIGIEASSYQELEDIIASKSETYFETNSNDEEVQVVTIQTLTQNNYLPQIYDIHNHDLICTGYVSKDHASDSIKTYLKCENEYQTEGYDALKDH